MRQHTGVSLQQSCLGNKQNHLPGTAVGKVLLVNKNIKCSAKLINFVKRELSMRRNMGAESDMGTWNDVWVPGREDGNLPCTQFPNMHTWHIFLPFCDSACSNLLAVWEKYGKTFHINGRSGWNVFSPLFLGLEAWWKLVRYCEDVCMEQY